MKKGEPVTLPAIPESRIDEIVLRAEMGMATVRSELDERRAAMLKRLAKKNEARLARVKAACEAEDKLVEKTIQDEAGAEIQLSEGGGLPDESLEGIGGGEDSEGAEQAQSLVKLERRVDRLLVTAGSDAAQVQKYLQDRHAQMPLR